MRPTDKLTFRPRYAECDRMGVLHHGNYLQYFEMGRTELMRKFGISYNEFESMGYMLPVIKAKIKYKKPIPYDMKCELISTVKRVDRIKFTFSYEILSEGSALTKAETEHAVVDKEGKLVRIPEILKKILNGEQIR